MRQSTQNTFKRIALYFILLKCWKMCFTARDVCHSYDQCQYADLCNSEGWRLIFIDFPTHSGTLRWSSFGELLLLEFIFHSFLLLVNVWKKKEKNDWLQWLGCEEGCPHGIKMMTYQLEILLFYCKTRFWFQNTNRKDCCQLFFLHIVEISRRSISNYWYSMNQWKV